MLIVKCQIERAKSLVIISCRIYGDAMWIKKSELGPGASSLLDEHEQVALAKVLPA